MISPRSSSCRAAKLQAPKLSFDHYMATETGYDGGNVKYQRQRRRVRGHPDRRRTSTTGRPARSPPRPTATPTRSPAEPGFTGTDGGSAIGSWGQSQVDLTMLGVAAGDKVEFRFDIGRDGCGGNDGWYVDNVA